MNHIPYMGAWNKRRQKVLTGALVLCFMLQTIPEAVFAISGINAQIPFQGVLQNTKGTPLTGTYDMTFRIYDAEVGGNVLWTGSYTNANNKPVDVKNGIFRVFLGSGPGNNLTLNFNDDSYFIGISIEDDSEMIPREQIGSSAYAINARLFDGYATSSFLASGIPTIISAESASSLLTINQSGVGNILSVIDGTSEVFTILKNGNVGIGITEPDSKLSILGQVSAGNFFSTSVASNTFSGALTVTSPETSFFKGNIQIEDNSGLFFGPENKGLIIYQDAEKFGENHLMIGMFGDALMNGYVNIGAPGALSFTANSELLVEGGDYVYEPSFSLNENGSASLYNRFHGNEEDRFFEIDFANGVRVINGNFTVDRGMLGVGTEQPVEALDIVGNIKASSLEGELTGLLVLSNGVIIREPSDARLKQNIRSIDNALATVLSLHGVQYEWKDTARFGTQIEVGFIAQDVLPILPEVVRDGGEYLSVNTKNIIAVVVEGIKEMYKEIQLYFARTERLEYEVEQLRAEIISIKRIQGNTTRNEVKVADETETNITTSTPPFVESFEEEPQENMLEENNIENATEENIIIDSIE